MTLTYAGKAVHWSLKMLLLCAEERNLDKLFREWLTKCHGDLDKLVRFEELAPDELQVQTSPLTT